MASGVLQYVTERKLGRLEKQQNQYEQHKSDLLGAKQTTADSLDYCRILLEGIEKWGLDKTAGISAHNVDLFLKQKRHDASVPTKSLLQWQQSLEDALDVQSARYEYASLFGKLVTEWTSNPNEANKVLDTHTSDEPKQIGDDNDLSTGFEPVGRSEMHKQRAIWEDIVFSERKVNRGTLLSYLEKLFDDDFISIEKMIRGHESPLEKLRKSMRTFEIKPFDKISLLETIRACLNSDLFAGRKRQALVDLKDRPAVIEEMVDVLNMDLAALDQWTWDPSPITVTQRRQINGKYRFYMNEEIHQALLLQYVGSCFAVFFKSSLKTFHGSVWKTSKSGMTSIDRKRRTFFLQDKSSSFRTSGSKHELTPRLYYGSSVKTTRENQYDENFFMLQMQDSLSEGAKGYGEEDDNEKQSQDPMESKHRLLRYLTTDMLYSLAVHKRFSVLQSDFKWFGPALPHDTILTVLKFLDCRHLDFIQSFLRTPMVFAQDGPDAVPQTRCRGVPMSHSLSDALGELILFCLDYAVNKYTAGDNLLRLHDDLWFWGSTESCAAAWEVLQEFSTVTGLDLNMEKTGSLQLTPLGEALIDKSGWLPDGDIKWGFLRLDAEKRGWVIRREDVDAHIRELHLQLSACRSVFAWIQAWNSYVTRFFKNNFGKAANCFGKEHLNEVIATFEHIQASLFPSGSVTAHLKEMISTRFGVTDIPDGFLCLPIELGGLDLRNPFVPLISVREGSRSDPMFSIRDAFEAERKAYHKAKVDFELLDYKRPVQGNWRPNDAETFFSLEEYLSCRDETSSPLAEAFADLMDQPHEVKVEMTKDVSEAYNSVKDLLAWGWHTKGYNKWIMACFGPEVIQKFGGLSVGDRSLLPVGLVNLLRSEKVRWQG